MKIPQQTKFTELKEVLMQRDSITSDEADRLIEETRENLFYAMLNDEDPGEVLMSNLGLEQDYLYNFYELL